jgi:hypothetical protein
MIVQDYRLELKLLQKFQPNEISRYRKTEEKSVEAKTSGIGHGSREIGRQTSSRRVKFKCALRVI